ncbi:MAG: hypothetical protein COT15_04690 [Candidatus Diapherotrites archaeon CG08_land_8_20_14_0_20_34_12]|nr:MAG: hypothetical protein COT15_04690 [Candidatus Diapherotrites archaeon CG08_land_8_20_14_0_20_34_12]
MPKHAVDLEKNSKYLKFLTNANTKTFLMKTPTEELKNVLKYARGFGFTDSELNKNSRILYIAALNLVNKTIHEINPVINQKMINLRNKIRNC